MCRPDDVALVKAPVVSGKSYDADVLAPEDAWIEKLDHEAFKEDVREMGKKLAENQGPEDLAHLRKIVWWARGCWWAGALTMPFYLNPLSIYLLSIGTMARWTIVGHHVCHGGFDKCSQGTYNRFKFGVGSLYRRATDWLDWMLVEAWNVEHNQLHHYCLGETADPDLVEMNLKSMRETNAPLWAKRLLVGIFMCTWKWYYYAPNTFKALRLHEMRRQGQQPKMPDGSPVSRANVLSPWPISATWLTEGPIFFNNVAFFSRVLGPYFLRQFVLLPLLVGALLGTAAGYRSLATLVLAELLTNVHSFIIIVTNHAGDDLYRFDRHCTARSSTFYLRQIISSVNFRTGTTGSWFGDLNDFHHGWLNYQIEHHIWPDLSMLSYQRAAPLMKALCAKHGVPYVQQSVWWRLKKTVDIMIGAAEMRKYPSRWEREADLTPLDTPNAVH